MKHTSSQEKGEYLLREILLFTGTNFSNRQYVLKTDGEDDTCHSPLQNLERACWSGMLSELLPELVAEAYATKGSFIWHIMAANHFLRVSMGPYPKAVDSETSIDPYFFLDTLSSN